MSQRQTTPPPPFLILEHLGLTSISTLWWVVIRTFRVILCRVAIGELYWRIGAPCSRVQTCSTRPPSASFDRPSGSRPKVLDGMERKPGKLSRHWFHYSATHSPRLCGHCQAAPARQNQRYCAACHATAMREYRVRAGQRKASQELSAQQLAGNDPDTRARFARRIGHRRVIVTPDYRGWVFFRGTKLRS